MPYVPHSRAEMLPFTMKKAASHSGVGADTSVICSGMHKHTCLPACSPDGSHIAIAEDFRLTIRELRSLQVVQLYSCLDRVQLVQWCSRSQYVACQLHGSKVQVTPRPAPSSAWAAGPEYYLSALHAICWEGTQSSHRCKLPG